MSDSQARRADNNGDLPIELADKDISDFAEIVQAALRVWPANVPTTQLWVRVFATPDAVDLERAEETGKVVRVVCIELLSDQIHVRLDDENEDDAQSERHVQADIGNMVVADVGTARDELAALGWTNTDGDYAEPPDGVLNVTESSSETEARENPGEFPSGSFRAQSIVFDNAVFTEAQAKAWAKAHGFRHGSVDAEENTWRIRQSDPISFQQSAFRTLPMTDGVQAVIGVPK